LTIYSGLTGDKGANFEAALKVFQQQSGIKVTHVGVANVQTDLSTRIQAGDPPDVALFPQPGLVLDFASQGKVVALNDILDMKKLKDGLVPGLLDTATVDGKLYAVPFDISVKSLMWYPPEQFKKAGYQVPKTFEQFQALIGKIRDAGGSPLCFGVESGSGTGWPATDWLEDLVLRTGGPEVYDKWVSHEIPFDSPEINKAMQVFGSLVQTDGNVYGGAKAIVTTKWSDSIAPMFQDPPGCWMYHQGSFMANSLPDGVQPGKDVDVFYLPPFASGGYSGRPVEGAGDMAALLKDSPNARKLMEFLASPDGGVEWAKRGGFLSPWKSFDPSTYADDLTRKEASFITDATDFRFDASDSMPGAVGTGSFFQQMTAWLNGDEDAKTALQKIDQTWPKS
jgi:alpha-glucoside transport system substrate-binding protein